MQKRSDENDKEQRRALAESAAAHEMELKRQRRELEERAGRALTDYNALQKRSDENAAEHRRALAKLAATHETELKRQQQELEECAGRALTDYNALLEELAAVKRESENREAEMAEANAAEVAALQRDIEAQAGAAKTSVDELIAKREQEIAELAEKQTAERHDYVRQLCIRRMKHRDMSEGWNAWVELWQAKTSALEKMRRIANHLNPKMRELAEAFYHWVEDSSAGSQREQLLAYERRVGKLMVHMKDRNKEIQRLKTELRVLQPLGGLELKREKQRKAIEKKREKANA